MTIRNQTIAGEMAQMGQNLPSFLQVCNASRGSPATPSSLRSIEIVKRLVQCLEHIIQTFDCRDSPIDLRQAFVLLESLPLTTEEYDLARHRLENALRYADSEEAGAAIYELRILLARFRHAS